MKPPLATSSAALVLTGVVLSCGALVAWKAADARAEAVKVVGEARSCIQVPSGPSGYRAVAALSDMTALTMSSRARFHGILVVGRTGVAKLYNWSYRKARWEALPHWARSYVAVRCVPRHGYLEGLTWRSNREDVGQPEQNYISLDGATYLISADYRAELQNATYISIDARPPNFEMRPQPSARAADRRVNLEFRSREWLESVAATYPSALDVSSLSNTTAEPPVAYVERDQAGQVTTLISCPVPETDRNPAPCQHRFYRDDAMWSFRQSIADLPRWREFQVNLIGRMNGFSAAATRCDADAKSCAGAD